jgi:hypothetical protein
MRIFVRCLRPTSKPCNKSGTDQRSAGILRLPCLAHPILFRRSLGPFYFSTLKKSPVLASTWTRSLASSRVFP